MNPDAAHTAQHDQLDALFDNEPAVATSPGPPEARISVMLSNPDVTLDVTFSTESMNGTEVGTALATALRALAAFLPAQIGADQ